MVQNMDRTTRICNNSYVSCIKINGKPILPPLMTPERRKEMGHYRDLAKAVEARIQRWARQYVVKRNSVDSGVTFSSNGQTPEDVSERANSEPVAQGFSWQQETSINSGSGMRTIQEQSSIQISGKCNEVVPPTQMNDRHGIASCEHTSFRPWEKIHGKDSTLSETRMRRTWQVPHHAAKLKDSLRQKWDTDPGKLDGNFTNAEHDKVVGESTSQTEDCNNTQEHTSATLKLPSAVCLPESERAHRELPSWEASLDDGSKPVKICEGVMDFSKSLQSEPLINRSSAWEQVKTSPFPSPETLRTSDASCRTLQSESLRNDSNAWEQVKTQVNCAFTSPEAGRASNASSSTLHLIAQDNVDDSTSSVAMTSSTDLNQYMNVTGSSGSGSPGRDACQWLAEDSLQRSAALATVAKTYPSRQELLLASLSDLNLTPPNQYYSDIECLNNLKNCPTRINDSNLKNHTYIGNEPMIQENPSGNRKLTSPVQVGNCTNYTEGTGDFRKDDSKCLIIPNVKLQTSRLPTIESENTKVSGIPVYTQLHSPPQTSLESQMEQDNRKMEVSPPRLVRQNSYTLESPSPLLIAHVETQKGKKSSHDMTENTVSSKISKKSSDSFQTKKSDQKGSSSFVSSPCNKTKVNRKTNSFLASPYRNNSKVKMRDRQICSLPASKEASPVKLKSPFLSLDCLPSAVFKEVTTPSKCKEPSKSRTSSAKEISSLKTCVQGKTARKSLSIENISIRDKNIPVKQDNRNTLIRKDDKNVVVEDNCKNSPAKHADEGNVEDRCECEVGQSKVSEQDLHSLVIRLQSEHSQQMAELLLKQKKEQEEMHRAFVEQQSRLILEIYKICPDIFLSHESEKVINSQSVDNKPTDSPANRSISMVSTSNPVSNSNMSLNVSTERRQSMTNGQVQDTSYEGLSDVSAFENIIDRLNHQNEMQEPQLYSIHSSTRQKGETVTKSFPRIYDSTAEPDEQIPQTKAADMEVQLVSCNRQLFPALKRKLQAPANRAELEKMAATCITAAVRGYLTRRLFRTARVQEIILTIRDTLLCAVQINQECWPDVTPEDVDLHRRLIQQVTAACHALHDVFFRLSTSEKMTVIATDRERIRGQAPKLSTPRPLSAATRRALERKMLQRVERRPVSAEPRPCRVRTAGFDKNSLNRSYDVGQSSFVKQHQGMNKTCRSLNLKDARKPWK